MSRRSDFEWDDDKDRQNQKKHGASFALTRSVSFLKTSATVTRKSDTIAWEMLKEEY